jgi:hypothetical protein
VPFTGAGVSVDAGVPVADDLALKIARTANDAGAEVEERPEFAPFCTDVTRATGFRG